MSLITLCLAGFAMSNLTNPTEKPSWRPPSVPLVAHDPYFSVWSPADKLTDAWPCHWTGRTQALQSMVRVDGSPFRLMGPEPKDVPALNQVSLSVKPTETVYEFANSTVKVQLTFFTPALPYNLDVMSRPLTYITWKVQSVDGKPHDVSIYFDATAELAVNDVTDRVVWSQPSVKGLKTMKIGTSDQKILSRSGDDLRIEWGYAYVSTKDQAAAKTDIVPANEARLSFAANKLSPSIAGEKDPRAASDHWPAMSVVFDCGKIDTKGTSQQVMLAYDDIESITHMGTNLKAWWRRNGMSFDDLLVTADKEYPALAKEGADFDKTLLADVKKLGGENYEKICSLAFRQSLAAHKVVADAKGRPLWFSKENFSNGCICTVDVTYPSAPMYLLMNPALCKGMVLPILDYAESSVWKFPFAPHDLGQYPLANGQVYGGGSRTEDDQMPVEESGNILVLMAAIAKVDGNADFSKEHWATITKWAEYLKEKGLDPEKQLCTDDFAGHLAHNTNLSIKAIVALGAYGQLCETLGKHEEAKEYTAIAKKFAKEWETKAFDGDHYRLAFDSAGSWSQKYNMVWDKILDLKLFSPKIAELEMAHYRKMQNEFGLPLDNRREYTKLDWITWTACLTGKQDDFDTLIAPIVKFLEETPNRVPMTDWYETKTPKHVGFQARSVVGGVFLRFLYDHKLWSKYASKVKH